MFMSKNRAFYDSLMISGLVGSNDYKSDKRNRKVLGKSKDRQTPEEREQKLQAAHEKRLRKMERNKRIAKWVNYF